MGYGSNEHVVIRTDNPEISAQLAETKSELDEVKNNPTTYNGAILTFIDDDIDPLVKEIWQPILTAKGINISFAVITSRVGQSNGLTLQELQDLQSQGNELISHTVNHYTTTITDIPTLDTEYRLSKQWLEDNGFKGSDILVYPGGLHDFTRVDIKNTARKYYKYAVATDGILAGATYSALPVDNWAVPRPNADTATLDSLKSHVDDAVANNGWLVLCTHAYELNKDKDNNIAKLNALIDYCTSLGVAIMPFSRAEKYKGNIMATGEFTKNKGTFISKDGTSKINGGLIINNSQGGDLSLPITAYQKNTKTVQAITSVADTFLNTGGVYEVFRGSGDLYSYATFTPWNSNTIYMRKWNDTTKVWNAFTNISDQSPSALYTPGFWTPVLVGETIAGSHTYDTQLGSWTKFANMITVRFSIRILAVGFDDTMSGPLRITGLPYASVASMRGNPREIVEYNKLTLGTNYSNVFVGVGSNVNYIKLYKNGSGVATDYLQKSAITTGDTVVFQGQITYQIPE